ADQPRAVAEAPGGDLVVADLDDQLGPERLPFGRSRRAPAAGTAGRVASEAGRLDQRLESRRQCRAIDGGDAGGEADMVEQPLVVVEAKEQRADLAGLARVAEATHDAVGGAAALDLDHRPLAQRIGVVAA